MAGRISWQIEFQGIDANLTKLREMDRLLNNVTRKGGTIGAGGGVDVGGTTIVGGGGGSAAGVAAAAAAGAAGAATGAFVPSPTLIKATQQLKTAMASGTGINQAVAAAAAAIKANPSKTMPSNIGVHGGKGTGAPPVIPSSGSPPPGVTAASALLQKIGPPIIPQWKRMMHSLMMPGDMKSGMGRAIASLSFLPGMSRVAAVFSKVGILGVGVAAAFIALLAATYALTKGIKAGAEAYENAAKLGKGVAQTSQLRGALAMLGINEQASEMMLLRGQMAERRGGRGGGLNYNEQADAMISAARVSGFGSAQQLANMPKEFAEALKDAAANAEQMAQSAHINLELNMELASIARELKTALAQLAAACAPLIEAFLLVAKLSLAEFNRELYIVIAGLQWIGKKLGLNVAATQPVTNIVSPGGSGAAQSAW